MITDALLAFVQPGAPMSLVGGAGVNLPSPLTIDLLGTGVGTPPANIIGNAALFGQDVGVGGRVRPELNVVIGVAPATGNAATLNLALQSAPDLGLAGAFQPGAWQTIEETGALTVAQLAASIAAATQQPIMRLPFPPSFPANQRPRYLRLLAQVPAATNFNAGTISSAVITMVRDDQANKFATKNFIVS